jgi:integrase/recombinase XerD
MIDLRAAVDEYLTVRRSLGYKLERAGRLLAEFITFCEQSGARAITTEVALAWAKLPAGGGPNWWSYRLGFVRVFAAYLQAIDPETEVPPTDLLPARRRRIIPYLYSDAEIAGLMAAARRLRSPLGAPTYETLIGLLAVTGLRIGEAIRLDRDDVVWDQGLLRILYSKFGKSREVPLHPTTMAALRAYARHRDHLCPSPNAPSFFVTVAGNRLFYPTVQGRFSTLVRRTGLKPRSEQCRPRIHDLRHTFAVRTLLGWYRAGVEVQPRLPLLSSYMGHADPKWTYWYLSAAPELLTIVGKRLEEALGELP